MHSLDRPIYKLSENSYSSGIGLPNGPAARANIRYHRGTRQCFEGGVASAHCSARVVAADRRTRAETRFQAFRSGGTRVRSDRPGEAASCRLPRLLNQADAVSERAQLLRRGDTGVLKVAASPQF